MWVAPPYQLGSQSKAVPSSVTITDTVTTDEVAPTAVVYGSVTVTTAGTRVQVSGTTVPIDSVYVKSKAANAGKIYLGGASVSATVGLELSPGEGVYITVNNLTALYVDSASNGDKITFIGS